jgi:hypothetical protein
MAEQELSGEELFSALDVLIVPSPAVQHDARIFPDVEPQSGLYVGGKVRLTAATEFTIRYAPRLIVLVGGMDQHDRFRMTSAMKDFVLERNPRTNVKTVNSLPCTRHNIVALFNQIGGELKNKKVAALSNEYHLPRFLAFWSKLDGVYGLKLGQPIPVAAETIHDAGHRDSYAAAYGKRLRAEAEGIAHLRAGEYFDKCMDKLDNFADELRRHVDWYLTPQERADPRAASFRFLGRPLNT